MEALEYADNNLWWSGVVYGVFDEVPAWSGRERDCAEERCCFGLRTAQGLVEFECENRNSKHNWVDAVQNLLRQVTGSAEQVESSLEALKLT